MIGKMLFDNIDENLKKKFKEYHQLNPQVFNKFKYYAKAIKKTGKTKYSAWTIIQVIRWEEDLNTKGDVFEINNDFIALYARLMIYHHKEFEGFFELRTMKTKRKISLEERQRSSNEH